MVVRLRFLTHFSRDARQCGVQHSMLACCRGTPKHTHTLSLFLSTASGFFSPLSSILLFSPLPRFLLFFVLFVRASHCIGSTFTLKRIREVGFLSPLPRRRKKIKERGKHPDEGPGIPWNRDRVIYVLSIYKKEIEARHREYITCIYLPTCLFSHRGNII